MIYYSKIVKIKMDYITKYQYVKLIHFLRRHQVRYVNNLFIAVSSKIVTSSDGENWIIRATGSNGLDVAYGNGIYVLITGDGISTSSDSVNWTSGNISSLSCCYISIIFASNKFVAVGTNGKLAISNDGVNWAQYTNSTYPATPLWGHHRSITYGPVQ